MRFDEYRQFDANLILSDIKGLNFGNIPIGEHGTIKIIRIVKTEQTVSDLKFYLRNAGTIPDLKIGAYATSAIDKELKPGDSKFTILTAVEDDNPSSSNPNLLSVNENDFIHLDISADFTSRGKTTEIKFASIFNFSSSSSSTSSSSSSSSSCSSSSCSSSSSSSS